MRIEVMHPCARTLKLRVECLLMAASHCFVFFVGGVSLFALRRWPSQCCTADFLRKWSIILLPRFKFFLVGTILRIFYIHSFLSLRNVHKCDAETSSTKDRELPFSCAFDCSLSDENHFSLFHSFWIFLLTLRSFRTPFAMEWILNGTFRRNWCFSGTIKNNIFEPNMCKAFKCLALSCLEFLDVYLAALFWLCVVKGYAFNKGISGEDMALPLRTILKEGAKISRQ